MDLGFNRLVQSDLRIVLQYYELAGGTSLGDRFFDELTVLITTITERPTSFHVAGGGLRRANMASFPYHLLFRERSTSVRILVLRHHRKHPSFGISRQ